MNIALIGMAGAGKSHVGERLARVLGFAFVDVDKRLEAKHGEPLQAILDRLGDEAFLKEEEAEVLALADADRMVIAPGGSIIYSKEAMALLKRIAKVVYLRVPIETIEARINVPTRGIVGLKGKTFRELYAQREAFYVAAADLTVDIERGDPLVVILSAVEGSILPKTA
jgi:shikimate kinase